MADDFEGQLMEDEASKNPIGIPECLADTTRRLVTLETARVDDAEAISKDRVGEASAVYC